MTSVEQALAAIEELDDDAILIGVDLDRVDRGAKAGRLAGEAIVVKDCIAVPDHPTTGGSPQLSNNQLPVGGAVTRLLAEGAVVVATTSMHELAFGITGRNPWRGTAINPAAPERLPGGSSSGSAVAVARGLVDVAIGTDTGGSCRIPAACCGVMGFRPSTGRYPSDGLLTLSQTRDTVGVLARSIADIARFDEVLAADAAAAGSDEVRRMAVADQSLLDGCDPVVVEAYRRWTSAVADRDIELVEVDFEPLFEMDGEAGFVIAHRESVRSYKRLCANLGVGYEEFVSGLASDDVRELMALEPPTSAARDDAVSRVVPVMQQWYASQLGDVDVLALPTLPALPPMVSEYAEMALNGQTVPTFQTMIRFTSPATLAGVPSLSVPIASGAGPVSVMLEDGRGQDRSLLAKAAWLTARIDGMG